MHLDGGADADDVVGALFVEQHDDQRTSDRCELNLNDLATLDELEQTIALVLEAT